MPRCDGGIWLPTHITFIYSIDQSLIYSFYSSKEGFWWTVPRCGDNRGFHARTVERWWRRREEEAGIAAVVEETGGVESGGVENGRDLKSFEMKSKVTRGGLLFIGSKISAVV
jgi:hypothetical protein